MLSTSGSDVSLIGTFGAGQSDAICQQSNKKKQTTNQTGRATNNSNHTNMQSTKTTPRCTKKKYCPFTRKVIKYIERKQKKNIGKSMVSFYGAPVGELRCPVSSAASLPNAQEEQSKKVTFTWNDPWNRKDWFSSEIYVFEQNIKMFFKQTRFFIKKLHFSSKKCVFGTKQGCFSWTCLKEE